MPHATADCEVALGARVRLCLLVWCGCGRRCLIGGERALSACVMMEVEWLVQLVAVSGMFLSLREGLACCTFKLQDVQDGTNYAACALENTWRLDNWSASGLRSTEWLDSLCLLHAGLLSDNGGSEARDARRSHEGKC